MLKRNGQIYICKSDIVKNYEFLCKHGFSSFLKSELVMLFEEYIDDNGADEIFVVGNKYNKNKQRHTQFVSLYNFYKYIIS